MKKILEFNMPDDRSEFEMANQGSSYHYVLWELSQILRNHLKYGHKFETADEVLESIQKELHYLMGESHCNFQE